MSTQKTLAIIGTAGRKDDASRLTLAHYRAMCVLAKQIMADHGATKLISGGAAWADHVAVTIALEGAIPLPDLTLYLPAPFSRTAGFDRRSKDGSTAVYYHQTFKTRTRINYVHDFDKAIEGGAVVKVNLDGFFARNAEVAAAADIVLAFTFGKGAPWLPAVFPAGTRASEAGLKDGGTAHTFDRSRAACKIHVTLGDI